MSTITYLGMDTGMSRSMGVIQILESTGVNLIIIDELEECDTRARINILNRIDRFFHERRSRDVIKIEATLESVRIAAKLEPKPLPLYLKTDHRPQVRARSSPPARYSYYQGAF